MSRIWSQVLTYNLTVSSRLQIACSSYVPEAAPRFLRAAVWRRSSGAGAKWSLPGLYFIQQVTEGDGSNFLAHLKRTFAGVYYE